MGMARLPINSLSGGVGRQVPTKRLSTEAENIDNCLVTLEKSVEKRPPLNRVKCNDLSYLPIINFNPSTINNYPAFNTDNLYFHFLDIDGYKRYCIVINRAGHTFDPVAANSFQQLNITDFISVFRIEPTEWVKETVDSTIASEINISGFHRGIFEYLTFGNKATTQTYKIGSNSEYSISPSKITENFGSVDFNIGIILWNKHVPLDFLPNNANTDLVPNDLLNGSTWFNSLNYSNYIHSGDKINYKTSDDKQVNTTQSSEDVSENTSGYWINVRDDIVYEIDPDTLEEVEMGQNLENFGEIPQYPVSEIESDINDANGFKALRMLYHYYDSPFIIPAPGGTINWTKDHGHLSSPLSPLDRDDSVRGFGKVYYARSPYLTFPLGFYRVTRYSKNPYLERIRTEEENSVFDHRRFPLHIYKDTTDGVWRVRHLPLQARRNGTATTNPGPTGVVRKETIQSMGFWKNRLWVATDNTVFASQTNNFFNFWINDIQNITDTDVIDIQANVGAYNKLTHLIPFQEIMFVSSAGSMQFEIRGGSIDTGISPFNVEFRPTSFFSTAKLVQPQRMGNNIFFLDSSRMYMYVGGSAFSGEYSSSIEMSTHCRGYLPQNIGAVCVASATNSILAVDNDNKNYLYFYTLRTNGDKIAQNSFYRWILSTDDQILGLKAYEKDLYIISKRPSGQAGVYIPVVYFVSLETTPVETPMLDWLYKVPTSSMQYSNETQNTILTLPYYDPKVDYLVYAPDGWGTEAYTTIKIEKPGQVSYVVVNDQYFTTITVPGKVNIGPIYVGRSYLMNVELSQLVRRAEDTTSVYEGVLNLKRLTTKHYLTGSYDVEVKRQNRESSVTSFIPLDINSVMTRTDQLKIDTVGEHFTKVLSYSEACKIFIKSSYPTPCNIANIEIIGTFRSRNTSIE
jgi:hypothetical protein